jgi:prepilin-type N-terminal cleavage/methylation domain-containing protein
VRLVRCLRRLRHEEHGYSLMELLTVMVIMGIVLGGLTTVFVSGSKAEYDMNVRFQAQQQTRLALDRVRRDIHVAGCVNPTIPADGTTLLLSKITTGTTCAAFAYYCVATSPTLSTKSALYYWRADGEQAGLWSTAPTVPTTCSAGRLIADDLIPYSASTPTLLLFGWTASAVGQLQKITVDLRMDASDTASGGVYRLKDDIVLRNSTRS